MQKKLKMRLLDFGVFFWGNNYKNHDTRLKTRMKNCFEFYTLLAMIEFLEQGFIIQINDPIFLLKF